MLQRMELELENNKQTFKVSDRPFEATIKAYWTWDDSPIETMGFESEQELEAYLDRFRTGELMNVVLIVEASFLGQEGSDVLGACHVRNEAEMKQIIKDHNMIGHAITELIDVLDGLVNDVEATGVYEAFQKAREE